MNPTEPQLPPISVRDCFFDILYRWRSLLLAAIIGALLEKRPERRILLAGTLPAEKLRPLAEAVQPRLAEKKNVQLAPDLLKNDRSVAEAAGAEAIILVEERFVSASREVLRAAEVLKIGGAPVVGAVLI